MKNRQLYLRDPDTGRPSVSLTMTMVSFWLSVGTALAIALGWVRATDYNPMLNVFITSVGLYGFKKYRGVGMTPMPGDRSPGSPSPGVASQPPPLPRRPIDPAP